MRSYIIGCGIYDSSISWKPGEVTPQRCCSDFEIHLFFEGDAQLFINGLPCPMDNCIHIAKPGQYINSRCGYKVYFLRIRCDCGEYGSVLASCPDYIEMSDMVSYIQLINEILKLYHRTDELFSCTSKLWLLADMLYKDMNLPNGNMKCNSKIQAAKMFMEKNFKNSITLSDIASSVSYSSYYFHRIFRKAENCTPLEYLIKLRIDNAKYLLSATDYSLSQIAQECGFASQSYFSDVFKRTTSTTPLQYRNNNRLFGNLREG